MERFPPDIQTKIWKSYFKNHVLLELPKIGHGDFEALPKLTYVSATAATDMLETVCRLNLYDMFKDTEFHRTRSERDISAPPPVLRHNPKFNILFENLDEYDGVAHLLCCHTIQLVVTYGWKKYAEEMIYVFNIKNK